MTEAVETDVYGRTVVGVSKAYDSQLRPLGNLALAKLAPQFGENVIDIGCGAAQTCLQLAEAVGKTGSVLGLDRSPVLTDFAAARSRHLPQVEIVTADVSTFNFKLEAYDALFSRFGVMAFADPRLTFERLRRAVKPDGRLCFTCWRAFDENELDNLPFHAASRYLPVIDVEKIRQAYPFAFSDMDYVKILLRKSGFGRIEHQPHDLLVSAGDLASTLDLCLSVGALGGVLRRKPELRDKVRAPVSAALEDKNTARGLFMNAAIWVVCAHAT